MDAPRRRIVLDGLNLGLERGTGIATYGRNVARVLADSRRIGVLYDRDVENVPDDELMLQQRFYSPPPDLRLPGPLNRISGRLGSVLRRIEDMRRALGQATPREIPRAFALHNFRLPNHPTGADILTSASLFHRAYLSLALTGKPLRVRLPPGDILHLTAPIPIVSATGPTLLTVHDVIPLRMPFAVDDRSLYFLRTLRALVKRVDHIVTVSESAKADLIAATGVAEEKVTVTYQPVRDPVLVAPDIAAHVVRSIYGLSRQGYFIFVGAIEPKKNIPRLIEAYLASGSTKPLVIVGPDGWRVAEQLETLERFQVLKRRAERKARRSATAEMETPDVQRIGWVPRAHLQALIANAAAMLFPSLYEGFGLPVVEAQLLGTPVLTSKEGSLAEIAGDAAVLVDASDGASIASGIARLDDEHGGASLRHHLVERGYENARRFSDDAFKTKMQSAIELLT